MSRGNAYQGSRPVTVPATTAPGSVQIISSACRLMGWSLTAGLGAGKSATGSVTSPAAAAVIASLGTVPADEYTVNWQVELGGTLAAADVNNFELTVAGILVAQSLNPAVAGIYPQDPVQIQVAPGGALVSIKAIALGTVGAVYSAALAIVGGAPMEATLFDAGQVIGQSACPQGFADTQIMTDDGIWVGTSLSVTVVEGTASGVLYIRDGNGTRDSG